MPRGTLAARRRIAVAASRPRVRAEASTNSRPANITEDAVKRVWEVIRKHKITVVDLKFNDLPGLWQHFSIPVEEVAQSAREGIWVDGIGFDGSSIRGFQKIQESDMNLFADPTTAVLDPVCETPTLSLICDIYDPLTRQPYSRDPRFIARKAEGYLKKTGIADVSYWGPEPEFFIFDDIRFDSTENSGYYYIDSIEGDWNTGRDEKPNLGYKPRFKEGYFPVPPHDALQDIRSEIMAKARAAGVPVEKHHHEVATAGQCEIDMRYATLTKMADYLLMLKYVIKNTAHKHHRVATFMPKPLFGDNGSGMHTHQSIAKAGTNLFFDKGGYAKISQMCKWYIGGLIKHAPAILAFAAPTTNSYKRSGPWLWGGRKGTRNPIDPGQPVDENIYEMEAHRAPKQVPGSLSEALDALEKDHAYLLKGDVFTKDVIDVWLEYKRQEIDKVRLRPHPYEFYLYFDAQSPSRPTAKG